MPKTYPSRPLRRTEVELRDTKVDIIIPYHGQYEKVYRLLKSIWISTRSNPYQICLVDDHSPNSEFIIGFEKAPWTKTKRNEERQLGFGGSLAVGFNETSNDFIVIMHSDCYVEDNRWLASLIRSYMALQRYKVGLVVARTNNPGTDADPRLRAEKNDPRVQDIILEEGCVPLYCALCERSLFQHIRGFIRPYPYGWYEDEELAHRMRKFGLKQAISGNSWIGHEGGATFDALLKKDPTIKTILENNRLLCVQDLKSLR